VWFTAHHGWVARLRGRFDEAMARGRAAVALARGTSDAWFAPAAAAFLGCTLLEAGDSGAAATVLREGLDGTSREGAEAYRLRCLAPLADATGDPDALAEAESLFAELDVPAGTAYLLGADIYLCLARAHLRCGAAGRARTVLAPLLSAAERLDWLPLSVAAGLLDTRARAALGDPGAEGARRQLAVLAERHGMARVLQARCNTAATRPSKLVPADNSGERERRHGSR